MAYDNTNKGALFPNQDKKTDKHPSMTGKMNVEGKEWRLSAWSNVSKQGQKYLSIVAQEPQQQNNPGSSSYGNKSQSQSNDDDLPF